MGIVNGDPAGGHIRQLRRGKTNGNGAPKGRAVSRRRKTISECADDVGEDIAYRWAEQRENYDHHDGNKNKDQGVFHQSLPLFTGLIKHDNPLSMKYYTGYSMPLKR
jgi:hypothetical protein